MYTLSQRTLSDEQRTVKKYEIQTFLVQTSAFIRLVYTHFNDKTYKALVAEYAAIQSRRKTCIHTRNGKYGQILEAPLNLPFSHIALEREPDFISHKTDGIGYF